MDIPMADAGTDDASTLGDVGVVGDGGSSDDGGFDDAAVGGDASGDARADARRDGGTGTMDASCACRTVGAHGGRNRSGLGVVLFGALAIVIARRRRSAR